MQTFHTLSSISRTAAVFLAAVFLSALSGAPFAYAQYDEGWYDYNPGYDEGWGGSDNFNPGYDESWWSGSDNVNPGYDEGWWSGSDINPGYDETWFTGDNYNPGYASGDDIVNPGYGDNYNPGYASGDDIVNPGYGNNFNPGYAPDNYNPGYASDNYNPGYAPVNYNPGYKYDDICGCYSYGSASGGLSYSSGYLGGFSWGGGSSFYGYPQTGGPLYTTPKYPTYPAPKPITVGGGSVTTNTTNTNITNIDNSIRDSFNNYNSGNTTVVAAPAAVAQPQYPIVFTPPTYYNPPSYYTPPVQVSNPQVALTQIPYTGFDMGPVGNAMYWAGLMSFAAAASYLMIYYKGGVVAYAGTMARARRYQPIVAPKAPLLIEREAQEAKLAPIMKTLSVNPTTDTMAIVQQAGSMPRIVIDRS